MPIFRSGAARLARLHTTRTRLSFRLLAALMLALSAGACGHQAPQTRAVAQQVDTLWYASSRVRNDGRLGHRQSNSLEYGFYVLGSRAGVDIKRDDIDMQVLDSARLSKTEFFAAVSADSRDTADVVVLSVHGYATDHNKAIRDAGEAYVRSGTKARWVAFSWPSSGKGMRLMQPGRFFWSSAYRADSATASRNKPAFAGLLLQLHSTIGGARLVVVTHSLGAQLATEAVASDSMLRARLVQSPLRAIGLFAPDLPAKRFVQYTVAQLRPTTRRLLLYASTNDGMLRFSSLVNRSDRTGLLKESARGIEGLETVDVTDGESSEDWIRRHAGTHHAMKKETGALFDFFHIVVPGRPASCRRELGTAELRADSVWHLLPVRARADSC